MYVDYIILVKINDSESEQNYANDTTVLNYTHMLEYLMKRKMVVLSIDGIVDTFMLPAAENNTWTIKYH